MLIQRHLVTSEKDSMDLLQLATHCQKIKQRLKKVDCSQLVQDQISEQNAVQKNNRFVNQNNATSLLLTTSMALVRLNPNFITLLCMAQISQVCVQMAVLLALLTRTTTTTILVATSEPLRLTKEKIKKLKKFRRCFNCKNKNYMRAACKAV